MTGRRAAWAAVLVMASVACTGDFTGLNQNPNSPTDAPSEFLLVTAMETGVSQTMGGLSRGVLGYFVQHTSAIEYAWDDRYDIRAETFNGAWNNIYSQPLTDLETIIQKEDSAGRPSRAAVPRILKSWLFQTLTDLWGDVPYTEALQGVDNILPVYDAQQDIYQDLLAEYQQARAALDPSALDFGANDIIYGGDTDKWSRFSASLQLRLGMRMSEVNATLAQSTIADALAAGVFQSRGDDALLRWLDNDNNANPWWSGQTESAGGSRIAATIVDTLKSYNDPRLPIYARPNEDGEYIGMQNGVRDGHGIPFLQRSRIGEYFLRRRNTPTVIMGYPEVLFLRAEAALRGWGPGDAATLYQEGITESMRYYGIPDTAITRYLAEPAVVYNPATGMTQIQLQKWIALFGNSPEAWANWRRTGVPTLVAGPDNVTAGRIPRRLLYPTEEQSLNNANLQAAITRQGGGTNLWDPVWFDPGPTP